MKAKTKNSESLPGIQETDSILDFSGKAFFKKKRERATEFLKKHPVPEDIKILARFKKE